MRATRWLVGMLGAVVVAAPAAAQDWGYVGIGGAWTGLDGSPVLEDGGIASSELKLSGPSFEFRTFSNEFTFGFRNSYQTAREVAYSGSDVPIPVFGKLTRFTLPFVLELGPSLSLQRMLRLGRVNFAVPPVLFDVRVFATVGFGLSVLNFVHPDNDELDDDFNLAPSMPVRFGLQARFWFLVAHVMYTKELWFGGVADELRGWPSTFEVGGGFAFAFDGAAPGGGPGGKR